MPSGRLLLLLLLPLLLSASRVTGQPIDGAPAVGDKSALLAFRASAAASEQAHPTFVSWAEGTEVCDAAAWN
jgi:hypothetical protein